MPKQNKKSSSGSTGRNLIPRPSSDLVASAYSFKSLSQLQDQLNRYHAGGPYYYSAFRKLYGQSIDDIASALSMSAQDYRNAELAKTPLDTAQLEQLVRHYAELSKKYGSPFLIHPGLFLSDPQSPLPPAYMQALKNLVAKNNNDPRYAEAFELYYGHLEKGHMFFGGYDEEIGSVLRHAAQSYELAQGEYTSQAVSSENHRRFVLPFIQSRQIERVLAHYQKHLAHELAETKSALTEAASKTTQRKLMEDCVQAAAKITGGHKPRRLVQDILHDIQRVLMHSRDPDSSIRKEFKDAVLSHDLSDIGTNPHMDLVGTIADFIQDSYGPNKQKQRDLYADLARKIIRYHGRDLLVRQLTVLEKDLRARSALLKRYLAKTPPAYIQGYLSNFIEAGGNGEYIKMRRALDKDVRSISFKGTVTARRNPYGRNDYGGFSYS